MLHPSFSLTLTQVQQHEMNSGMNSRSNQQRIRWLYDSRALKNQKKRAISLPTVVVVFFACMAGVWVIATFSVLFPFSARSVGSLSLRLGSEQDEIFATKILTRSVNRQQSPAVLLTTPSLCVVTADVRGNLGAVNVVMTNGTDWIKDRWQAASNMHGKAIEGEHWLQFDFHQRIASIEDMVLDWETAYSDHYELQVRSNTISDGWHTILSAPNDYITVTTYGTSPGLKKPTPLHYVHSFNFSRMNMKEQMFNGFDSIRILILKASTGIGVSLWQVQMYGRPMDQ
jgi:hypothetical protein